MELSKKEEAGLEAYARYYHCLLGDERTRNTFDAVVQGIIGSQSLRCAQIAVFSPGVKCVEVWGDEGQAFSER